MNCAYCDYCGRYVRVTSKKLNLLLHLLLTVFTSGIWFPVWLVVGALHNPHTSCALCGNEELYDKPKRRCAMRS